MLTAGKPQWCHAKQEKRGRGGREGKWIKLREGDGGGWDEGGGGGREGKLNRMRKVGGTREGGG